MIFLTFPMWRMMNEDGYIWRRKIRKKKNEYSVQVQENVYFLMFNVPKPTFDVKSYHVIPLSIEMCGIKKDHVLGMINRRKL